MPEGLFFKIPGRRKRDEFSQELERCNCREAMASRPFSMHDEPEFLGIVKLLREADATYAHLEANLGYIEEIDWAAKVIN